MFITTCRKLITFAIMLFTLYVATLVDYNWKVLTLPLYQNSA